MRAAARFAAPILTLLMTATACHHSHTPPANSASASANSAPAATRGTPAQASPAPKSAPEATPVATQALDETARSTSTGGNFATAVQPAVAAAHTAAQPAASGLPGAVTSAPETTPSPVAPDPSESDNGASHPLVVRPLRFLPAAGTGFPPITVDATGKVTWGATETATVVGNAIVFSDGSRAATWLDDDRIIVAGWAETFKLTPDHRIEGEQGLRIALDNHGLASVADPAHRAPAHSIGRFDAMATEARPLAELVILIQQVRHPPVPEGAPTTTKTPHLYVFHPTHPGEKASKAALSKKNPAKKPLPAKKKSVTKKKPGAKKKP